MIRHELYKIFINKSTLFVIFAILVLNAVQLVYIETRQEKDYSYSAPNAWSVPYYVEVWKDITEFMRDKPDDINGINRLLEEEGADIRMQINSLSIYEYYKNYDKVFVMRGKLNVLNRIQEEIDSIAGYNNYLDSIENAVKRYEIISVFANKDTYAYRELVQMEKMYKNVSRKTMSLAPSAGVRMASHSDATDILALILLLYFTITVWLKEKEQNVLLLIRTAKNGRVKLAAGKLIVLVTACVGAGVLLYATNFVIANIIYDMGDLSRPLASVYDYGHTLWEISVGEFLVLNIVFKIFSYIFVMLILSIICLLLRSSVASFAGIIMMGGAGCLLYYKIPALSVWTAFKYLNPFAVLKTEILFEGYRGINFFEHPVDQRLCMTVLFVVGYAVCSICVAKLFNAYIIKGRRRAPKLLVKVREFIIGFRRKFERHTSVLLHEMHRIFICHGTIVIIIIAAVLIVLDIKDERVIYSSDKEYVTAYYTRLLEGPVTDEKLEFIKSEKERFKDEFTGSEAKTYKEALEALELNISNLNDGAYILYDTPHGRLTATSSYGSKEDILKAIYVMSLLVVCMPCFFAPDLQSNVNRIVEVTAYGKKKLKKQRYIFGITLAVAFVLLVHLSPFIRIMMLYKVKPKVMTYPANSIGHLVNFSGISIGVYYLIQFILRIASAVLASVFIYGLSRWIKSPVYTMFAGMAILMLPLILAVYIEDLVYAAYPHSMFLGNLFLQNKYAAVTCVITWALLLLIEKIILTVFKRK